MLSTKKNPTIDAFVNIEAVSDETIKFYIAEAHRLRSEKVASMTHSAGHGISKAVKSVYHFATDWIADLYHPKAG